MAIRTHAARPLALASLLFLASASTASAQSLCEPTESILSCRARLELEIKRLKGEIKPTAVKEELKTDVPKKTETGIMELNGLSSSVKDFVPLLQLTGALGAFQKDDKTGAVSIALNTPFFGASGKLTDDRSLQLKAVVETAPKLFDKVKALIPAKDRDAVEKQLLGAATNPNNTTLHASYNFTTKRLGRNFARYSELYDALVAEALSPVKKHYLRDFELMTKIDDLLPSNVSLETTLWGQIPSETRFKIEEFVLQVAQSDVAMMASLTKAIESSGVDLFGQLINSQPQLHVTAFRTFRDDLYGPDLLSGKITFEMGLGNNLNAVFGANEIRDCAEDSAGCLKKFTSRLKDPEFKANVKAGSRLTAYVEFVQNEAYHFTNLEPALDLAIEKGTTWIASLEYGRLFGVNDTGAADGRVDGSVKWEIPAESTADRRFVASLTITKKLGELSVPFGIVYANKSKFLTGVDKGLGVNVGLKFNLFPGLK